MGDPVVTDALKLLFAKEGNYVQDLVVEEMARMTDALGREANLEAVRLIRRLGDGMAAPLPQPIRMLRPATEAAITQNPLLLPLQVPYLILDRLVGRFEQALELTDEDRQSLRALRRLVQILLSATTREGAPQNPLTAGAAARAATAAAATATAGATAAAANGDKDDSLLLGTGSELPGLILT
ncbi:unnamed protein product, partial [Phaeothamnion confervicola]